MHGLKCHLVPCYPWNAELVNSDYVWLFNIVQPQSKNFMLNYEYENDKNRSVKLELFSEWSDMSFIILISHYAWCFLRNIEEIR